MPEGEEEEQEIENVFEKIMEENFLNLMMEIYIQFQEAQRVGPEERGSHQDTKLKCQRLKIKIES